jgi:hypothetical protein
MARKCHPIGTHSCTASLSAWPLPHQTSSGSAGAAARSWHKFWACSCSRQLVNSMVSISAWPVPAAGSAS